MRNRFEQEIPLGTIAIPSVKLSWKSRDSITPFLAALQKLFVTPEYNEKIFKILEEKLPQGKTKTGRPGMDLWQIFVLAQFRLCLNISYDRLHDLANNHKNLRLIMGIEKGFGYEPKELGYQNIIDNVSLLNDQTVKELNEVIVEFGHGVFKKKEAPLRLKTDSFVVETNVHFPTDCNLLWDCSRKCLDTVRYFLDKFPSIQGWRKIDDWYRETKIMMRILGKTNTNGGKDKEKRAKKAALEYLTKVRALEKKITLSIAELPLTDISDMAHIISLESFLTLMTKHIDLVNRRLILGEKIPQEEKMFSIFEQYTEWITKGKLHPNVELGKKLSITTDQFGLIVDYRVMDKEADSEIVIDIASILLKKFNIASWSFDKGFWHIVNWTLLSEEVPKVVMPKKGKRNAQQEAEETDGAFKRLRKKHSAIESNINELECRGLDRCPDRGFDNFKRYVGFAVGAYNLTRIGRRLVAEQKQAA